MRTLARLLLLALAFALATIALGWWAVPLVAAAWALVRRGEPASASAAAGAAIGWAALLAWIALRGPLVPLASQLGGVMGIPAVVLPAVTLFYPAVLAWSAAYLTSVAVARRSVAR
jgi:hypothetical protein